MSSQSWQESLLGKADAFGLGIHVSAKIRMWKRHVAERDRRIALQLAIDADLRVGNGIARPFVNDAGLDRQQLARRDKAAHLGFLDRGQKRHALELHQRDQQPARGLRHRLDEQDAGHDGVSGEMSLEDRIVLGNLGLDRNRLLVHVEVENAVNQLEIFELHGGRLSARGLGGDEFVDAGAQVLQDEILFGRRLAVVDLLGPLFQRQLDPERLVDRKRDIKEIEAVDAQIVNGVAFRRDRVARNVAGFSDDRGDLIECRGHH